jgi:hypothetical protein
MELRWWFSTVKVFLWPLLASPSCETNESECWRVRIFKDLGPWCLIIPWVFYSLTDYHLIFKDILSQLTWESLGFSPICLICSLTLLPLVLFLPQLRLDWFIALEVYHLSFGLIVWSLIRWLLFAFLKSLLVPLSAFPKKQLGLQLLTDSSISRLSQFLLIIWVLIVVCWLQKIFSWTRRMENRLV